MEKLNFSISYLYLLIFIAAGIVLYFLLGAFRRLVSNLSSKKLEKRLQQFLPLLEGVIWFGFLVLAIRLIFQNQTISVFTVIAVGLVILAWFSWFAIRDLVAGLLLKFQGAFNLESRVRVKDVEGRVKRMGYLSLELESYQGEIINIPYGSIFGDIRSKPNQEELIKSHRFEVKLPKKLPVSETVEQVRITLLNAPWSSVVKKPHIKVLNEDGDLYRFEIIVYSLHAQFFQKIKSYLVREMEKI